MAGIPNRINNALLAACLVAAVAAAGCQTPPAATPVAATASNRPGQAVDDCASRLHDICGQLLLYYSVKGRLPQKLEETPSISGEPLPPLLCPVSQKPYTYNRGGVEIAGTNGRAIVYDSQPTHSGARWAIVMETVRPGKPLVARVVQLPREPAAPQAGLNLQSIRRGQR